MHYQLCYNSIDAVLCRTASRDIATYILQPVDWLTGILDILCKYFCQAHFCVGTAATPFGSTLSVYLDGCSILSIYHCFLLLTRSCSTLGFVAPSTHINLALSLSVAKHCVCVRRVIPAKRWDPDTSASPYHNIVISTPSSIFTTIL